MATAKDVEAQLNTHEAVCAERWKETIERIKRLEKRVKKLERST